MVALSPRAWLLRVWFARLSSQRKLTSAYSYLHRSEIILVGTSQAAALDKVNKTPGFWLNEKPYNGLFLEGPYQGIPEYALFPG